MLTQQDKELIFRKGISEAQIESQLESFKKGFPFLTLYAPATTGNGILALNKNEIEKYLGIWDEYLKKNRKIVPASGAASRMFKALFEFL